GKESLALQNHRIKRSQVQSLMSHLGDSGKKEGPLKCSNSSRRGFSGKTGIQRSSFWFVLLILALSTASCARHGSAENLSPLGTSPRWTALNKYQETMTHDVFVRLFKEVYCPNEVSPDLIKIGGDSVRILKTRKSGVYFTVRFSQSDAMPLLPRHPWA